MVHVSPASAQLLQLMIGHSNHSRYQNVMPEFTSIQLNNLTLNFFYNKKIHMPSPMNFNCAYGSRVVSFSSITTTDGWCRYQTYTPGLYNRKIFTSLFLAIMLLTNHIRFSFIQVHTGNIPLKSVSAHIVHIMGYR